MSWNGSGVYTLPALYFPEADGNLVDATRYNGTFNDVATGLNNALTRDGQTAASADQPMGGFKHTGAGSASSPGEYLVFNQAAAKVTSLGINTPVDAWHNTYSFADIGARGAVASSSTRILTAFNSYVNGAGQFAAKETGVGGLLGLYDTGFYYYAAGSVAADAVQTMVQYFHVSPTGQVSIGATPTAGVTVGVATAVNISGTTPFISLSSSQATTDFYAQLNVAGNFAIINFGLASKEIRVQTNGVSRLVAKDTGVDMAFGSTFGNVARAETTRLDWYEEGTFTPTVAGVGSPIYVTQTGQFTRIGNMVHFSIQLSWTGGNTASITSIAGLPYTSAANIQVQAVLINYLGTAAISYTGDSVVAYTNGAASLQLAGQASSGSIGSVAVTAAGQKDLAISGSYRVA